RLDRLIRLKLPLDRLRYECRIVSVRELDHLQLCAAARVLERVGVTFALIFEGHIAGNMVHAKPVLGAGLYRQRSDLLSEIVRVEADVADRSVLFPRGAAVVENEDRLARSGNVLDDRVEGVRKVIANDQRRRVTARRLFDE